VRFNDLPRLVDGSAVTIAVQDEFRKYGFPEVITDKQTLIEINIAANATTAPSMKEGVASARRTYVSVDRRECFTVLQDSLIYSTTNYKDSGSFTERLLSGLRILDGATDGGLALLTRVGLRFLDAVQPAEGEDIRDYLNGGLMGLPETSLGDGASRQFCMTQSQFQLKQGVVAVRTIVGRVPAGSLPLIGNDLLPLHLTLDSRFKTSTEGTVATCDTDSTFDLREPFSLDRVSAIIRNMKDAVQGAFESIVTPYALEQWK